MTNFCIEEDDYDNFYIPTKIISNIQENKNNINNVKKINDNNHKNDVKEIKEINKEEIREINKEITNNELYFGIWSINYDNRLKNEINDFNVEESFKIINNLKLKSFTYNKKYVKDNNKYVGLVAQDIEKVLPESIKTQKKNINNILIKDFKLVDIDQIVKHLVGTVQFLTNKIEYLENILDNIKENSTIIQDREIKKFNKNKEVKEIIENKDKEIKEIIENKEKIENQNRQRLKRLERKQTEEKNDIIKEQIYENIHEKEEKVDDIKKYENSDSEDEIIKIKGPKHAKKILESKNEKLKQKFSKKENSVKFNPAKSVRLLKKSVNTHIKKSIKNSKKKKEDKELKKEKRKESKVKNEDGKDKKFQNQLVEYVKPEMVKITDTNEDDIISIDIDKIQPTSTESSELVSYKFSDKTKLRIENKNNENCCEYVYIKGKNAGNKCSKKINGKNEKYCNMHKKNI